MFQIEFKKLTEHEISAEELVRAKKYLIGQHDIGLQRKGAICNLIAFDEIYGNDYQKNLDVVQQYASVTTAQVRQLAIELFSRPYVISIVGRDMRSQTRR